MTHKNSIAIVSLLILPLTLTSCAKKQDTGALVGTVVGIAVGSLFGSGSGKIVSMIVGSSIGALVGNQIGGSLDEADRIQKENATQAALDAPTGNIISWTSEIKKDVSGASEAVEEPVSMNGSVCRAVQETIIISGDEEKATSKYCWNGQAWNQT